MKLASIRPGDIIEADVRGLRFFARVEDEPNGQVQVEPLTSRVSYRLLKPRQVVGHYRRSAGSR